MNKNLKKQLNNQGSILQIVLVTFLIMVFSLTLCLSLLRFHTTNYHDIDLMMKQKNLEIMLVDYYSQQMENDMLMSDDYQYKDYEIETLIDDMGTFYEITTRIKSKEMNYMFLVEISTETYDVLKFEYGKEG